MQPVFTSEGAPIGQTPLCIIVGLTIDAQGVMYIPESFYGAVLRVAQDGTVSRIAGTNGAGELGDGGPPLQASLQGSNYFSPPSVALDGLGNMFLPQSGANRIREIIPGPLAVRLSKDRLDFAAGSTQTQTMQVSTNVAEPLPFGVRVSGSGNTAWLGVNRVAGQTGDTLAVSANPAGLAPGVYSATLSISVPSGAAAASMPVTLTVK
jgi:hypothetical protein